MKYLFLLFALCSLNLKAQQKVAWPGKHTSVIILTYDDALESQLNNAVPQLKKARLPATFFLSGDIDNASSVRWRKLAGKGYELANHTLFHPCEGKNDNPVSSDGYTVSGMLREIKYCNNFLYALDGKTSHTFAYPCTDTTAGGKGFIDSLRESHFVKYARLGGDTDAIITDFRQLDPLRVPSYGLDGNSTAEELIAYVQHVQESGGLGIIMFHGIGGDYITTSIDAHQRLIQYLSANRRRIWVTTFQQGMDYITAAEDKAAHSILKQAVKQTAAKAISQRE